MRITVTKGRYVIRGKKFTRVRASTLFDRFSSSFGAIRCESAEANKMPSAGNPSI